MEMLTEAITEICKTALSYEEEFTVEGLLGITLDRQQVLLININEEIKTKVCQKQTDLNNYMKVVCLARCILVAEGGKQLDTLWDFPVYSLNLKAHILFLYVIFTFILLIQTT